jgi:hypothetical protein
MHVSAGVHPSQTFIILDYLSPWQYHEHLGCMELYYSSAVTVSVPCTAGDDFRSSASYFVNYDASSLSLSVSPKKKR